MHHNCQTSGCIKARSRDTIETKLGRMLQMFCQRNQWTVSPTKLRNFERFDMKIISVFVSITLLFALHIVLPSKQNAQKTISEYKSELQYEINIRVNSSRSGCCIELVWWNSVIQKKMTEDKNLWNLCQPVKNIKGGISGGDWCYLTFSRLVWPAAALSQGLLPSKLLLI